MYPRSRIASSNRRSASCSNRSSMRRSAREVTASVPFFVCLRAILFAPSRRGRGCHDALREVDGLIKEGFTHVVDGHPSQQARADVLVDSAQPPPRACCDGARADLASDFDTIPQDRLMARVEAKISDGRLLELIRGWLKADLLKGTERWTPAQGSPQGAVISPLLANIYLHPLDVLLAERGYRMVRYADDFVILCRTRAAANAALAPVSVWVSSNGLTLHPSKTHVGDCRVLGGGGGEGFEFLGYRFEAGRRDVRKKSLTSFKDRVRDKTGRSRGVSLERLVADLNPTLRGWFGSFKHAHRQTFGQLDGFVRRRLRALLRKREKRPGQGICRADHQRWPNAYFANAGLFALDAAWHTARQSR